MEFRPISGPWSEAKVGDVLGVVADYRALLTTLRLRADACGFSYSEIERRSGLPTNYLGKLFGPRPCRRLGEKSLAALLEVLGLKIALVVDCVPAPPRVPKVRYRDRHPVHHQEETPC